MREQEILKELPDSVQAVCRQIIKIGKPRRLWLFGSRARGDHRENSDFDLAVEGVQAGNQWTALLLDINDAPMTLYAIEVLEFDKVPETYRKNIKKEGKLLYG